MYGRTGTGLPRGRALLVAFAVACTAVAAFSSATTASAAPPPKVGIVCTPGSGGVVDEPIFNLTTKTGYISLPDGNTAFMWGYSSGFDEFQHPGPVLCVNEGDTVTVILHNTLDAKTSIVFPGQENVLADGKPAQPEFDGPLPTDKVNSLTGTAAATDGTVTYSFVAENPGTYLYESGTNSEMQVRMGLFGALIVRPDDGPNYAYNRSDSSFDMSEEFMVLLSEIDPYLNRAVERSKNFNMNNYHPRYWLINGRGFPDSIADNGASWLPSQPYGALADIQPFDENDPLDQPALARYLNVGTEDYPFHPHGNNGLVIGRDGQSVGGPNWPGPVVREVRHQHRPGSDLGRPLSLVRRRGVQPGQPSQRDGTESVQPGNRSLLQRKSLPRETEDLPPNIQTVNQCGEYYIISHNHALHQITSWGANMTGPITYMKIEPPDNAACQQ